MNPSIIILGLLSRFRKTVVIALAVGAMFLFYTMLRVGTDLTAMGMARNTMWALGTGGVASVLGMWIGRDKSQPKVFAVWMSLLIVAAVIVGVTQSHLGAKETLAKEADLQRIKDTIREIGSKSDNPELRRSLEQQFGFI